MLIDVSCMKVIDIKYDCILFFALVFHLCREDPLGRFFVSYAYGTCNMQGAGMRKIVLFQGIGDPPLTMLHVSIRLFENPVTCLGMPYQLQMPLHDSSCTCYMFECNMFAVGMLKGLTGVLITVKAQKCDITI